MSDKVGPFRDAAGLSHALTALRDLESRLGAAPPGRPGAFDPMRVDWFDLRNMLLAARAVTEAALARTESRGAHQREDFPGLDDAWTVNQFASRTAAGDLEITARPPAS